MQRTLYLIFNDKFSCELKVDLPLNKNLGKRAFLINHLEEKVRRKYFAIYLLIVMYIIFLLSFLKRGNNYMYIVYINQGKYRNLRSPFIYTIISIISLYFAVHYSYIIS